MVRGKLTLQRHNEETLAAAVSIIFNCYILILLRLFWKIKLLCFHCVRLSYGVLFNKLWTLDLRDSSFFPIEGTHL